MATLTRARDGRQLCLFENQETAMRLEDWLWCRSFERQESTLHSLAPYTCRSSPSLVQALIELYSQPGETVLDPFAGSGTVAFGAAGLDRVAWTVDRSPYACTIAAGKLSAPQSERRAVQQAIGLLEAMEQAADGVDLEPVPAWVKDFFHPQTLQETIAAFQCLRQQPNEFLTACLVGILHHVLPGYLSYPSNASAPYLRRVTYAPDAFPHLYTYRDVRSRLLAKIRRTYRRHRLPASWVQRQYQVWQADCGALPIADRSIDAIVTQPPHPEAFESVRNHRLRLWFLGYPDWQTVERDSISVRSQYETRIAACLEEMARVLKPDRPCVLLLRDVLQHGQTRSIAETLGNIATATGRWSVETIHDHWPDRATRSSLKPVKFDRVLVLRR